MAKAKSAGGKIPRFTINKASKGKECVGKLSIPTIPIANLGAAIGEALANAKENGVDPKSCRAVISLY